MGAIALWLLDTGVPKRLIYPLIYAVAALGVIGAAALAIHLHTRNAIREHDVEITAAVASASTAADAAANASDAVRAAEATARASENQETINAAVQAYPVEVRRPVGPAVSAITDKLRARQATPRPPAK